MTKSVLATLFLGVAATSLPALAGDSVHSCVVNIELGNTKKIECYESGDLSVLKARCERRKKTFFNAKDYYVEENKGCPAGHYGVCRAKSADMATQYYYLPSNSKVPINVSNMQEYDKGMCELMGNAVWESSK